MEESNQKVFIVKEACGFPSNWRSSMSLHEYLKKYNVVGIQGLDTRALTKHLRNYGAQDGNHLYC